MDTRLETKELLKAYLLLLDTWAVAGEVIQREFPELEPTEGLTEDDRRGAASFILNQSQRQMFTAIKDILLADPLFQSAMGAYRGDMKLFFECWDETALEKRICTSMLQRLDLPRDIVDLDPREYHVID
ncbi:MAG: hypothetical protein WC641_01720 [Patescibacteria group bacterium]